MRLKLLLTAVLCVFCILLQTRSVFSQVHSSVHYLDQLHHEANQREPETEVVYRPHPGFDKDAVQSMSHAVYGFHPYWISDATASGYYYSLLTHVAYFSAEVDESSTTTGGFTTTRNWSSTQVVNYCKSNGVKIHLTVTMFDNHSRVLANATYRANLINNIKTQLALRSADGVNIDFEGMAADQKTNFRLFISELGASLKPDGYALVIDLPAVDWNGIFDNTFFTTVNTVVDQYFIMAYDYYWRGSTTAGPISPVTTGTAIRHVERSIDAYTGVGLPGAKMIAGFNYYGYQWPVVSDVRMATTTGQGVSRTYAQVKTELASIPAGDRFYDDPYKSPWYRHQNAGQWYQTWYDDATSLTVKYNLVKSKGIAGTGMWALSYDGANTELWQALKSAFASGSNPDHTILADFEASVGVFNLQPTFSGSTAGILSSSSTARSVEIAKNGWSALKIILKDDPGSSSNWTARILSGGGEPVNNQSLSSSGYIGFWLKSSSIPSGSQIAVTVDDGAGGTELSPKRNVSSSSDWVLYEWNLQESGWTDFNGGNGIVNGPTVTLDAIMLYAPNGSSDWTLFVDDVSYNGTGPLPVELVNFSAVPDGDKVALTWQTVTEVNAFGYAVEHTNNENAWKEIGFVPASGNSNVVKAYKWTTNELTPGSHTFRLRMIDADGSFKYSNVVSIQINVPLTSHLAQNYPNPFNPETSISYTLESDSWVTLSVYDLSGAEVALLVNSRQQGGNYSIRYDASGLASGVYLLRLNAIGINGSVINETRKMVLMR